MQTLGQWLVFSRLQRGIDQQEAVKRTQLSTTTLSRLENDHQHNATLESLMSYANGTGIPLAEILDRFEKQYGHKPSTHGQQRRRDGRSEPSFPRLVIREGEELELPFTPLELQALRQQADVARISLAELIHRSLKLMIEPPVERKAARKKRS